MTVDTSLVFALDAEFGFPVTMISKTAVLGLVDVIESAVIPVSTIEKFPVVEVCGNVGPLTVPETIRLPVTTAVPCT